MTDSLVQRKARAFDWMLTNDVTLIRLSGPPLPPKAQAWRAKWVRQDGVMAFGPAKPTAEEAILAALDLLN